MNIKFENYWQENKLFFKQIIYNISKVMELKSEYEHEKYIQIFECDFAKHNESKYAIAVNSGTTALQLALEAAGIKKGDEVIVPSYTYIATAIAVSNTGAIPVFVDIKQDTLTLDYEKIEKNITKKTKALLPVHIHGNPCNMEEIVKIAKKFNLRIIEDASHAHGAKYKGINVGNFGMGCFSTQTNKNLSGIGNGGLITLNDVNIYRLIKNMITVKNDPYPKICRRTPCQIDAIQAAIISAKLPYLNKINEKRRSNAALYIQNLPRGIKFQKQEPGGAHVYRDFVILTKKREKLRCYLQKEGIETKVRYEIPLHLTKYYRELGHKRNNLPITEKTMSALLWLPVDYYISNKEINWICSLITRAKFYGK